MTLAEHPTQRPVRVARRAEAAANHRTATRRRSPVAAALVALAAALAVIVAADGQPAWRAGRLAAVVAALAAGRALEARARPRGRGVAALCAGVVGTSAGVGIGVMHVVKGDVGVVAVAGLVALAAGLVLLVAGTARLWRQSRGWWRLLALPIGFAVLELALIPLSVAIYATNVPRSPFGDGTPADHGLAYENVTFTTSDGVDLSAWYVPSRNRAALVLLHGSGSDRTTVLDHAAVLAGHGYGVVLLDARGYGRSGGDAMDFGWWGDLDVAAAVDWLLDRPEVDGERIAVVGMSMGGEEAIGAAATNPAIRAVVAEGALWRGAMDTGWLPRDAQGLLQRAMIAIQTRVTELLTSAPRPPSLRDAIATMAPRPLLLIVGEDEVRGGRWYWDGAPGNVELWEPPGTGHTQGLDEHPDEWEARVVHFLDRTLLDPT